MSAKGRQKEVSDQLMKGSRLRAPIFLEWRSDGLIARQVDGTVTPVKASRCFPWTEPARYISLRDERGNEVGLVKDPATLDDASRHALERALAEADFILVVESIESVEEEFEIRRWSVVTRQGERRFQTRRDEWPWQTSDGGFLIRDVAGDLYRVEDPEALDERSRRLFCAFTD